MQLIHVGQHNFCDHQIGSSVPVEFRETSRKVGGIESQGVSRIILVQIVDAHEFSIYFQRLDPVCWSELHTGGLHRGHHQMLLLRQPRIRDQPPEAGPGLGPRRDGDVL